tara:strand:- start:942 stop:1598 length:657 start_codon:yes stop_codon:yes gene_type:complete
MATRTFTDMVTRLASSVPGCPNPVIEYAIRDAAIEVCERTAAWRYQQADITLTAGTFAYAFVPPDSNSEVHSIFTSTINDSPIKSITIEQAHRFYPDYPSTDTADRATPRYLIYVAADKFQTVPVPNASPTYKIKMHVALKPLRTATGMDKGAMDDLEDVIMHGALQHLLVLPERTWSDRELAAYHAKQYAFKSAERRARANVGPGRAVQTAVGSFFA